MTILVILNRKGGSAGREARQKVCAALAEAGVEAELEEVDGDEAADRARAARGSGARLVVAAGGDGTVSAVAGALAGSDCALGVIPLGTLNHFARDLAIPSDPGEACALLAAGTVRRVDVGEVNGHVFVNNSALGLYPLLVIDREAQQRHGRPKKLAMLVAAARAMARFGHHRLTLSVAGRKKKVETPLLFVGNNDYRLAIGGVGRRDSLADGHLCLFVLRSSGRLGLLATAFRALIGRARADDLLRLDGVCQLSVDSPRRRLALSLDGEVRHLQPPLDYRIRPGALRVVAP